MKIRTSFVSNSSSSSFIVTKELKTVKCMKLSEDQKKRVFEHMLDSNDKYITTPDCDVYLTPYIYMDGWDELEKLELDKERWAYSDGQMCGEPYDEEYFNNYDGIYLKREDDKAKQMSCGELIKMLVDEGSYTDYIVDFKDGDIILHKVNVI